MLVLYICQFCEITQCVDVFCNILLCLYIYIYIMGRRESYKRIKRVESTEDKEERKRE